MTETLDNLEVQYTYHKHEGTEGTTANGCYIKPVYHVHRNSCYSTPCGGSLYVSYVNGTASYNITCNRCGQTGFVGQTWWDNGSVSRVCSNKSIICGLTTSTIDSYTLSCGKTENTIESATIIY